jgi:eukaryotic-like serine/threonine-protein kinase
MTTELAAGTTLAGRYRIERLLGAGGMASVWVARDERLNRLVALKVISDTLAVDASYRARFEREARLAAGLSHANLVKVLDYGTESGRPVPVM